MAKVFLDANIFIDIAENRGNNMLINDLDRHTVFISSLSLSILFYITKYSVPSHKINNLAESMAIVSFDGKISKNSMSGPTKDFEDNIQLHSSAEAECDVLLTNDKNLLKLTYFGKTHITSHLL